MFCGLCYSGGDPRLISKFLQVMSACNYGVEVVEDVAGVLLDVLPELVDTVKVGALGGLLVVAGIGGKISNSLGVDGEVSCTVLDMAVDCWK